MGDTTLVIMAAGMGSRYGGVKQAASFGPSGEWLMDYAIYDAQQAGFKDVVIITRTDLLVDMQEHLQKIWGNRIPIQFAIQQPPADANPDRTKPWGTGQAILATKELVKNPFVVINADDFYGREAYQSIHKLLSACKAEEPLFALVGYPLQNTLSDIGSVSRGVCTLDKNNKLISITEMTQIDMHNGKLQNENSDGSFTDIPINSYASMNFWGFTCFLFDELETQWKAFYEKNRNEPKAEFLIPTVVSTMMKAGKVEVQLLPDGRDWCGVTYSEEKDLVIAALRNKINQGIYPSDLSKV
ncbi:MAG TPA: NTP transferase domain-containing protein [Chitinophagales bacterium]|nr:NTP transferase domain-containing protein [Chitinophagales bacterium]